MGTVSTHARAVAMLFVVALLALGGILAPGAAAAAPKLIATLDGGDANDLHLSAGRAVWVNSRGLYAPDSAAHPAFTVDVVDLASSATQRFVGENGALLDHVRVSGDWAVWVQSGPHNTGSPRPPRIRAANLRTGDRRDVYECAAGESTPYNLAIGESHAAWVVQEEDSSAEGAGRRVMSYDLATGVRSERVFPARVTWVGVGAGWVAADWWRPDASSDYGVNGATVWNVSTGATRDVVTTPAGLRFRAWDRALPFWKGRLMCTDGRTTWPSWYSYDPASSATSLVIRVRPLPGTAVGIDYDVRVAGDVATFHDGEVLGVKDLRSKSIRVQVGAGPSSPEGNPETDGEWVLWTTPIAGADDSVGGGTKIWADRISNLPLLLQYALRRTSRSSYRLRIRKVPRRHEFAAPPLTLSGRVVNERGAAVSGVRVYLQSRHSRSRKWRTVGVARSNSFGRVTRRLPNQAGGWGWVVWRVPGTTYWRWQVPTQKYRAYGALSPATKIVIRR